MARTRPVPRTPDQLAPGLARQVRYQPKARDASAERVRELAGIFVLSGPVPSRHFLDDVPPERAQERARD